MTSVGLVPDGDLMGAGLALHDGFLFRYNCWLTGHECPGIPPRPSGSAERLIALSRVVFAHAEFFPPHKGIVPPRGALLLRTEHCGVRRWPLFQ